MKIPILILLSVIFNIAAIAQNLSLTIKQVNPGVVNVHVKVYLSNIGNKQLFVVKPQFDAGHNSMCNNIRVIVVDSAGIVY